MLRSKKPVFIIALLLIIPTLTFAQSKIDLVKSKFGKGISIAAADSSFSLKFSTRFQNLMTNEVVLKDDFSNQQVATTFQVRRARIKFDGFVFTPKLEYKVEVGLSNSDHGPSFGDAAGNANMMMDAVVKYEFAKNTSIWFGQTKLPGNRERVISSQALQFVDRSLVNSRFNIDRDMGFQLHHHFKIGNFFVREIAAVSQGEGRNITKGNRGGLEYTARIEILPFGEFTGKGDYFGSDLKREKKPKLSIAATYDHNNHAARSRGNLGSFLSETRTLNTVFADFMFKYSGFSFSGEYAYKTTPNNNPVVSYETDGSVDETFYTGSGYVLQTGYLFKNNWEIAGRYTQISPDAIIGESNITEYTLGFSKYIVGHSLKIQTDFVLQQVGNNDPELMHRLQMELAF